MGVVTDLVGAVITQLNLATLYMEYIIDVSSFYIQVASFCSFVLFISEASMADAEDSVQVK